MGTNIVSDVEELATAVDTLTTIRNDERNMDRIIDTAVEMCSQIGIDAESEFQGRRKHTIPFRFDHRPDTGVNMILKSHNRATTDVQINELHDNYTLVAKMVSLFIHLTSNDPLSTLDEDTKLLCSMLPGKIRP